MYNNILNSQKNTLKVILKNLYTDITYGHIKTWWLPFIVIILLLKDRQQEVRPVLVASQYIGHFHVPLGFEYMYHIHFISLVYGLLIDVKYIKIIWIDTIRGCSEFENLNFFIYFLNKDISFNIPLICLKFSTHAN